MKQTNLTKEGGMNIFKITTEEDIFVVIAETEKEAKEIVIRDYFDGEKVKIYEVEKRDLSKGIVGHHDYEDFYWETNL